MRIFIDSVLALLNKWRQYLFPSNQLSAVQNPAKKKLTKKQRIIASVILGLFVVTVFSFGYYYEATGRNLIPFLNKTEDILPPKMGPEGQMYEQVINLIKSDDTHKIQLEIGFNCVDVAIRIWRNATWEGIRAYPIVIQYNESPGHMIIAFPTKDRGNIFIEPQNDWQVSLRVGQNYNNRKIRGLYVLDYAPVPLENSPQYDLNITSE